MTTEKGLADQSNLTSEDWFHIAVLAALGSASELVSEFFREAAVLATVFIPLDIWKHNEITWPRVTVLTACVLAVFAFGMTCKWIAMAAKRVQKRLEGG